MTLIPEFEKVTSPEEMVPVRWIIPRRTTRTQEVIEQAHQLAADLKATREIRLAEKMIEFRAEIQETVASRDQKAKETATKPKPKEEYTPWGDRLVSVRWGGRHHEKSEAHNQSTRTQEVIRQGRLAVARSQAARQEREGVA